MSARFYVPGDYSPGSTIALPDDESQHGIRVLRLAPGATVRIFDGRGHEFAAAVRAAGKRVLSVDVGPAITPAPEPRVAVTLVQAVLKGDKMDDVVRDAVMMGVAAIQPVVTTRSETSVAALERGRRHERWQRIAVASVKQCGRAVVPPVAAPVDFARVSLAVPGVLTLVCVEPGAGASQPVGSLAGDAPAAAHLVVGPEGGWTQEETERARVESAVALGLGARTLRADAVATVALAALLSHWNDL